MGILTTDLACAISIAVIFLALPLCIRYVTAFLMSGLLIVHAICLFFVDYKGHMMSAYMERDMRAELLSHFQTLSLSFFDDQKYEITHDKAKQ
ncbi:MAG: ATP-binding cassette subfamily B protein [Candidatus Azotimanducaceae bacterium]